MRVKGVALLCLWCVVAIWSVAEAQEAAWTAANERTARLCAEGKDAEAARSAEEAARLARQSFGDGHPNVAASRTTYEEACKGSDTLKGPADKGAVEEMRRERMREAMPKASEMPMRTRGLEPKRPDEKPSPILGTQGREIPRKDGP